jgi:hypothetical protein
MSEIGRAAHVMGRTINSIGLAIPSQRCSMIVGPSGNGPRHRSQRSRTMNRGRLLRILPSLPSRGPYGEALAASRLLSAGRSVPSSAKVTPCPAR